MAKCLCEPTQKRTYRITSTFHESESSGWEWSRLLTKRWEWSRTNVGWLSVMSVGDNRDRAQPTCGHGTCGCTFWLKFFYFTWILRVNVWIVCSEFAWLLFPTALSILCNHFTENISRIFVDRSTGLLPWLICSWFYSFSPYFTFILNV